LLLYEQHSFFGKTHTVQPVKSKDDRPTKKIRLTKPMISNNKRLMLAFDNEFDNDVTWALNTLLMLSCNTARNYIFKNNQLLEKIISYMRRNME
jgi:hypothetical protein